MTIFILSHPNRGTNTTTRLLYHYLSRRHRVREIHSWSDMNGEVSDAHLLRCFPGDDVISLAAFLEREGSRAINSISSYLFMLDKHAAHLAFAREGLPQLPWATVSQDDVVGNISWQGETILKPARGSRSRGIEIAASPESAKEKAQSFSEDYLLQPFLKNARSWRLVVGRRGGVLSSYFRLGDGRIASVSVGSERIYANPGPEALRIGEGMLRAVGGEVIGADLLQADGEFFALEANSAIGLDRENEHLLRLYEEEVVFSL